MNKMNLLEEYLKNNDQNTIEYYQHNKIVKKAFTHLYRDTAKVVRFIEKTGIRKREKIGLLSDNCYEVVLLDLACILGGWHLVCFPKESYKHRVAEVRSAFGLSLFFAEQRLIPGSADSNISPLSTITSLLDQPDGPDICAHGNFSDEDTFTTVFTSGSTGTPKGLEVRYKCPSHFIDSCLGKFELTAEDKMAIFLPLSQFSSRLYVYGAILGKFNMLLTTPDKLFFDLRLYKPTIIQAVPYFFESIYESMMSQIRKSLERKLVYRTIEFLSRHTRSKWLHAMQERIFKEIHDFFGGSMRIMVTGAAPIRKEVLKFFNGIGIPLYEAYGLVETGLITLSYPGVQKTGSVGKILPDKQVEFDAEQQIIVRSPYFWGLSYVNTSQEISNSFFHSDGRIATGDIGYADKNGFLFLTGRLTDVIVLSNGNKIHPMEIEKKINGLPLVKQSAVFGYGKPYPVCVIAAKDSCTDHAAMKTEIKKLNRQLSAFEQIKGFVLAREHFSPQNQLLNQSLKLDRKRIHKAYEKEIEALYAAQ